LAQLELDFPDAELIAEKEWFSRLLTSADSKVKEGRPWDAIHPLKNLLLKEPSYFANSHPDLGEISAKLAELETMFPNWERDEIAYKLQKAEAELISTQRYIATTKFIKYLSLMIFILAVCSLVISHVDIQAMIQLSQSNGFKGLTFIIFIVGMFWTIVKDSPLPLMLFLGWAAFFYPSCRKAPPKCVDASAQSQRRRICAGI
jgi:hypothetical protein